MTMATREMERSKSILIDIAFNVHFNLMHS